MKFADVLVPVPLDGSFTYSIPPEMERDVVVGKRVVVEFGKRKKYSAIVVKVHDNAPGGEFEIKPIAEVLDSQPVVTPEQISFWKWIADYYICSPGEVMTAAMPAGMKLASESIITINPDDDGNATLSEREQKVKDMLATDGKMSVSVLESKTGCKNIMSTVRSLYDKGVVRVNEVVASKYKARQETRVELAKEYFSEKKLENLKLSLQNRKEQLKVLEEYLRMSSATAAIKLRNRNILRPVSKQALLKAANSSTSPLDTLRKNGVLQVMKVDITRLKSTRSACMPPQSLSKAQQSAYNAIAASFSTKDICLLHGVTSSGKTEIYIHLIARALAAGRSVLYLLPEIALTTQITNRLRLFFGDDMGVYHSKFPDNERNMEKTNVAQSLPSDSGSEKFPVPSPPKPGACDCGRRARTVVQTGRPGTQIQCPRCRNSSCPHAGGKNTLGNGYPEPRNLYKRPRRQVCLRFAHRKIRRSPVARDKS